MNKITKILVYTDKGAGLASARQLINCFEQIYGKKYEVDQINSSYILSGQLNEQNDASRRILCFGGGYDLGYLELLGEKGCEEIRKFVMSGNFYLGICAGAYFATDYIEFDLNGPLEVKGERYLKFFNGKAIGPLNHFRYSDFDDNAVPAKIKLAHNDLSFYTYLNGGCHFEPSKNDANSKSKVIATYIDEETDEEFDEFKIAIVECEFGLGKCLLSGVHFEFDANSLNIRDALIGLQLRHKLTEANKKSSAMLSSDFNRGNQETKAHSNYDLAKYLFNKSFDLI